jgi:hypothetical protein
MSSGFNVHITLLNTMSVHDSPVTMKHPFVFTESCGTHTDHGER